METIHKIQDSFNEASHRAQESSHENQPGVGAEKLGNRVQETVQEGAHRISDSGHQNDTVGQKIDRVADNISDVTAS